MSTPAEQVEHARSLNRKPSDKFSVCSLTLDTLVQINGSEAANEPKDLLR